jgi:hypothetical protein
MAFCLPALPSSRLPQSVQNTREPIAAIVLIVSRQKSAIFTFALAEKRARKERAPALVIARPQGRAESQDASTDPEAVRRDSISPAQSERRRE